MSGTSGMKRRTIKPSAKVGTVSREEIRKAVEKVAKERAEAARKSTSEEKKPT